MRTPRTERPGTAAARGTTADGPLEEWANKEAEDPLDVWADEYSARARRARVAQGKSLVINDPTVLARLSVIINRPPSQRMVDKRVA